MDCNASVDLPLGVAGLPLCGLGWYEMARLLSRPLELCRLRSLAVFRLLVLPGPPVCRPLATAGIDMLRAAARIDVAL